MRKYWGRQGQLQGTSTTITQTSPPSTITSVRTWPWLKASSFKSTRSRTSKISQSKCSQTRRELWLWKSPNKATDSTHSRLRSNFTSFRSIPSRNSETWLIRSLPKLRRDRFKARKLTSGSRLLTTLEALSYSIRIRWTSMPMLKRFPSNLII